jgi:hypothetical protein
LKILKAILLDEVEAYRIIYQSATLLQELDKIEVILVLYKLRCHIYIFRNQQVWRVALENQYNAANIKHQRLSLDMPIRWNSTYNMIKRHL